MENKSNLIPVHPGEILLEEFLIPLGISQNLLARNMRVQPGRINEIVKGKRGITAETAIRLACAFDTTADFWMNLQMMYDLHLAESLKADICKEVIPCVPA
jgi:addiction module HigA family antidote